MRVRLSTPLRPEDVSPNTFLSDISLDWGAELDKIEAYIGNRLFPDHPVDALTGTLFKWSKKGSGYQIDRALLSYRRPGARSARVDFGTDDPGTYTIREFAQHTGIPVLTQEQASQIGIDLKVSMAKRLTRVHRVLREYRKAAILCDPAVITQTSALSGTNRWDNAASDPFVQFLLAATTIYNATGMTPNVMGMDQIVKDYLRGNSKYVDRYKAWTETVQGHELAPNISGMVPWVSKVRVDVASEGQDVSLSSVWGKNVVIGYVPTIIDKDIMIGAVALVYRKLQQANFDWFEAGARAFMVEIATGDSLQYPVPACFYLFRTVIS